jgi:hypothetical protein
MDEESQVPAPRPVQDEEPLTSGKVIGDGPMTPRQSSYLHSLCEEAGVEFDGSLTAAEAGERIEELKARVGRGGDDPPRPADREA